MRRLTILLAALGALMLVPVTQALAAETATIEISGTGGGEVSSVGGAPPAEPGEPEGEFEHQPPIECSYASPGPATGTCSTTIAPQGGEYEEYFAEEYDYLLIWVKATPAPGSEFAGFTIEEGTPFYCGGVSYPTECLVHASASAHGDIKIAAVFNAASAATPNLALNIEEGSGTVVSNPAGLECTGSAPKTCEAEVAEGSVTLTASPAPGYLFKSWKNCETVNGRQCTITATGSLKTVGAKFVKVFSLEGSKSGGLGIMGTAPGGINCGYACTSSTALYKEGALTVKAKPAKHFHFVKFQNGTGSAASCNGVTTETCTIATFNSNSALEEVYAEDAKNTLSVSKEGGGQGFVKTTPANINCGYTCTAAAAQFYFNESAAITVTLNKGTTKVTWTTGAGTCTGNALTCSVPMSAAHSLVAKFE